MEHSLTFTIRKNFKQLRPSEQKVADVLLAPDFVVSTMSIVSLSEAAGVSQPTVIRFANALGLKGFREMKQKLLEEKIQKESRERPSVPISFPVSAGDKLIDVPAKVISTNIQHMGEALKNLSSYEFIRAVDALVKAKTIAIFGVENSTCVADDLKIKLYYMGMNALYSVDPYLQNICARNLTPGDVAIGISYTGISKHTVDSLRIAKEAGATTIALTNYENVLLNKYAEIILCTGNEQYFYGNAIFSRCTQLAVVDMLYTGILLTDYEKYSKNIESSGREISEFAYR